METKRWRLVVTETGEGDPLHDVTVSAKQWRTALQRGRAQIGEPGGVPKGSSYAVAPDGTVTITDNIEKRSYVLTKIRTSRTKKPVTQAASKKSAPTKKAAAPPKEAPEESNTDEAEDEPVEAKKPNGSLEPESGEGWQLLHRVDHLPTTDTPILYVERSYHVQETSSHTAVESALRDRLAWFQQNHEEPEKGKLFRIAAFAEAWESTPNAPPVATIEWRDWRGDPVLEHAHDIEEPKAAEPKAAEPKAAEPKAAEPKAGKEADRAIPAQHEGITISMPPPATKGKKARRTRTSTDEHDARLAHAFEGCQDLFFCETPADSLNFIIDLLQDLLPTEASSAFLYDYNNDEFLYVAVTGPNSEGLAGQTLPGGCGLLAVAAYSEATLVAEGATTDSRYDAKVDAREGVKGEHHLVQPLVKGGRVLGALRLIDRSDGKSFSQADGDLLSYIGRQVTKFIFEARNRGQHAG